MHKTYSQLKNINVFYDKIISLCAYEIMDFNCDGFCYNGMGFYGDIYGGGYENLQEEIRFTDAEQTEFNNIIILCGKDDLDS